MKYCPKCGSEIKNNMKFCQKCGAKLPADHINLNNEYCKHCGSAIPKGATRCPKCDRYLDEAANDSHSVATVIGYIFSFLVSSVYPHKKQIAYLVVILSAFLRSLAIIPFFSGFGTGALRKLLILVM